MGFFAKTLTLFAIFFGILWGLHYGYESVMNELSSVMDQTYGSLGDELDPLNTCSHEEACSGLESIAKDLQDINDNAQRVLGTSSND